MFLFGYTFSQHIVCGSYLQCCPSIPVMSPPGDTVEHLMLFDFSRIEIFIFRSQIQIKD